MSAVPDPRVAEHDEDVHSHRFDITPAMVACDPAWTADPRGNPFFAELVAVYGRPSAYTLWVLAAEWHYCELDSELRYRALGDVA